MDDPDSDMRALAAELVDLLLHPEGKTDLRRVHSLGIGASGIFVASEVAAQYCKAEHFRLFADNEPQAGPAPAKRALKRTPVTVRFSNASGSAIRHDGWTDVRGMAVRFHLDGGPPTDLIAMTLPEFFTVNARQFKDFSIEAYPKKFSRENPWCKIADYLRLMLPKRNPFPGETIRPDDGAIRYADKHDFAKLATFEAAAIGAPVNYVRAAYHAVHTFFVTAPDGTRRPVRFTWQPIDGVQNINLATEQGQEDLERNYLDQRLRERIAKGPARFSLMMVLGETGDALDDPSRPWPPHRVRINMGTLSIDTVFAEDEQLEHCELLRFNPWHLTDGIEASAGDKVLEVRKDAYEISSEKRLEERGARICPFAGSVKHGQ